MYEQQSVKSRAQSANNTHMVFADGEHEKFYYEKLEQARYQDCYHKALIYILGISEDTRNHFGQIYDIKSGYIKTECLHQGWQTSGSVRVVRLAFNLYTDGTPSVDDYKRKDEQIDECRRYSVSDIFCCGYALYFWQGIQLRYPEYCREQRSVLEKALQASEQAKHRVANEKKKQNEKKCKAENHHKYIMGGIIVKYLPDCCLYNEGELNRILPVDLQTKEC